MALRRSRRYHVIGIGRNPDSLKKALRLGAVDAWSQDFSSIKKADIVVIATPVSSIVENVRVISKFLKRGAVITDAGSVKGAILKKLSKSLDFVGAHPIAGSHKTGVSFARADLFKKAICVIVPSDQRNTDIVSAMWRTVGAIPVYMRMDDHDQVVALISHLPHVLAHAMVQTVMKDKKEKVLRRLLAGSFRDVTRVASSDADQWASILNTNANFVKKSIHKFIQEMNHLERKIGTPSLAPYLRKSQKYREPLFQS